MSFAPMQKFDVVDLNDIAVFVRVAQFGSFSRAAHALGMPVSTVSRKVTALEQRLGVTLLQRTTRKLSLTAQGRAYYNQCSEPLSYLFDAERSARPRGSRRVFCESPRRSSLARSRSMHSCPHF